jgi:hypothetical protein
MIAGEKEGEPFPILGRKDDWKGMGFFYSNTVPGWLFPNLHSSSRSRRRILARNISAPCRKKQEIAGTQA